MNSKLKGDIGELIAAKRLLEMGWSVSFPFGENIKYDLIAEKGGVFRRVQVKSVFPRNGVLRINCRSSNNWSVIHYSAKDFEFLAAVDLESEAVYFIPVNKIKKNLINLRIKPAKNLQNKKVNIANNFKEF